MTREFQEMKSVLGTVLRPWKYYPLVTELLKKQLCYTPSKKQINKVYRDFVWFRIKYWGSIDDFFKGQIYRKSDFSRQEALSKYARFVWRDSLQAKEEWIIFQDKREFYKEYNEFLNRKWMIVGKETKWEEFCAFLKECSNEVFVKAPLGFGGQEVEFVIIDTEDKQKLFFAKCQEEEKIIEEKLVQCEECYSFSNSSVNTFRIITLIDDNGHAHVADAAFRIGRSNTERDNFSSGGMAAHIDVETGVIYTTAKDGNGKEYLFHPDTGKQIVGYKISDWEGYKNFAIELALKHPKMRYVGWDIIKHENGRFCVIEGNKDAGVYIFESARLYGMKPIWDNILHTL